MSGRRLEPASGAAYGRLLAVGPDCDLRDEILRLGAASGLATQAFEPAELGANAWSDADLVVIDADCADEVAAAGLPPRSAVVIVTTGRPGAQLWSAAVDVGAEQVVELPAGELWLVERLAESAGGSNPIGPLIAVIGGCGGAGATTLAAALALSAARAHHQPVLLGADPLDGIDIVLGAEEVPGPRWPDLAGVSGRLASAAILDGLPQAHGVRFLGSDRAHPAAVPLPALAAVVTAARRTGGPVIVDLPRIAGEAGRWLGGLVDLGLVLSPATVGGAMASRALATELGWTARTSGLAVRPGLGRDVDDAALAAAVGLPVIVRIGEDPRLARLRAQGVPPGLRRRSSLTRSAGAIWRLVGGRVGGAA